tara:strand:+ start:874 stop:1761 length:888 start_codon:yes stop_codon:yes gene_type:complete
MSNYSELCPSDSELLGTGAGNCAKTLGADVRFFLTESTFTGTAAQLKLQTYWDAAIIAKTVVPFPMVTEIEPQDVEASYFESASGETFKTKDEKRKTMFKFIENIIVHSGMKSYADRGWNIWYYTEKGYLRCHTKSEDLYEGLKASRFFVNAQATPTFSDPSHTPCIIEQNQVNDWDLEFGVIKPDFDMRDLVAVNQAKGYSASSTQTTGTLTVNVKMTIKETNAALSGLVTANFVVTDEDGATVTLTSAAEAGTTGVYALVATNPAVNGQFGLNGVITIGGVPYSSALAPYVTS